MSVETLGPHHWRTSSAQIIVPDELPTIITATPGGFTPHERYPQRTPWAKKDQVEACVNFTRKVRQPVMHSIGYDPKINYWMRVIPLGGDTYIES